MKRLGRDERRSRAGQPRDVVPVNGDRRGTDTGNQEKLVWVHGGNRAQCAEALDRLVDEESYPLLVACLADRESRVRVNALHALACDRCKQSAACRPDKAAVLPPAVRCLRHDPDKYVRAMAVAVVGRWVHSDETAAAALVEARDLDPEPLVRKSAGWYCPGGPIHRRTAAR